MGWGGGCGVQGFGHKVYIELNWVGMRGFLCYLGCFEGLVDAGSVLQGGAETWRGCKLKVVAVRAL